MFNTKRRVDILKISGVHAEWTFLQNHQTHTDIRSSLNCVLSMKNMHMPFHSLARYTTAEMLSMPYACLSIITPAIGMGPAPDFLQPPSPTGSMCGTQPQSPHMDPVDSMCETQPPTPSDLWPSMCDSQPLSPSPIYSIYRYPAPSSSGGESVAVTTPPAGPVHPPASPANTRPGPSRGLKRRPHGSTVRVTRRKYNDDPIRPTWHVGPLLRPKPRRVQPYFGIILN